MSENDYNILANDVTDTRHVNIKKARTQTKGEWEKANPFLLYPGEKVTKKTLEHIFDIYSRVHFPLLFPEVDRSSPGPC